LQNSMKAEPGDANSIRKDSKKVAKDTEEKRPYLKSSGGKRGRNQKAKKKPYRGTSASRGSRNKTRKSDRVKIGQLENPREKNKGGVKRAGKKRWQE